jgi:hypothetical protein
MVKRDAGRINSAAENRAHWEMAWPDDEIGQRANTDRAVERSSRNEPVDGNSPADDSGQPAAPRFAHHPPIHPMKNRLAMGERARRQHAVLAQARRRATTLTAPPALSSSTGTFRTSCSTSPPRNPRSLSSQPEHLLHCFMLGTPAEQPGDSGMGQVRGNGSTTGTSDHG